MDGVLRHCEPEPEQAQALRIMWALETSHNAAIFDPAGPETWLKTRLFFMRHMRTFCGEADEVAKPTRLAAMILPKFSSAFNCATTAPPYPLDCNEAVVELH
ncbi:uncharacterized protein LOC144146953 [Haemaphysalis longicornis]